MSLESPDTEQTKKIEELATKLHTDSHPSLRKNTSIQSFKENTKLLLLDKSTGITWKDCSTNETGYQLVGSLKSSKGVADITVYTQKENEKQQVIDIARRWKIDECKNNGAYETAEAFLAKLGTGKPQEAYDSGHKLLQEERQFEKFVSDITQASMPDYQSITWNNCVQGKGGIRADGTGTFKKEEGEKQYPLSVYIIATPKVLNTQTLSSGSKLLTSNKIAGTSKEICPNPDWCNQSEITAVEGPVWKPLDVLNTESAFSRISAMNLRALDFIVLFGLFGLVGGVTYIIFSYARGLRGSPRELYLMFFTKVTEYSAYGAMVNVAVLYLISDLGLSDISAGLFFSSWSIGITVGVMLVGAICDTIGIKNTLLIGCVCLLIARLIMPFCNNIWLALLFGFIPLAVGIAITGPVLKVGIKQYTTKENVTLGFGLFYTLMNVGFAIGGWYMDSMRHSMGETTRHLFAGFEFSTYQVILAIGFFLTIPDLIAIMWMRKGAIMTEEGLEFKPINTTQYTGGTFSKLYQMVKDAGQKTVQMLASNFSEKAFWNYLFLLGILVFVKVTFFIFQVMFPSYMVRVFGPGARIGIFMVFNPILIIFFVPIIASLTRKVKSYKMLLIGTAISALAVFLAFIPISIPEMMVDSWFGNLVFDYWLQVPHGQRDPFYLSMIIFIFFFSIGEAIWSPRLMQFSAEIAPKGREGSYIALAILPYFLAKLIVGFMAGFLLDTYTPAGAASYPNHQMVWLWVGGMALLSPIGLVIFKSKFKTAEKLEEAA